MENNDDGSFFNQINNHNQSFNTEKTYNESVLIYFQSQFEQQDESEVEEQYDNLLSDQANREYQDQREDQLSRNDVTEKNSDQNNLNQQVEQQNDLVEDIFEEYFHYGQASLNDGEPIYYKKKTIEEKSKDSNSSDTDENVDDDQMNNKTIIIDISSLPNFIYKHYKIIKFQQILSEQNTIALIDEDNKFNILKLGSQQELDLLPQIKEEVIKYDNENFFFVKENKDQISIYKKIKNYSYQKQNQQFEIPDFGKSNLVFSHNGNYLLKQQDTNIEILNLQNNQIIVKSQNQLDLTGVNLFALFPNGKSFVTGYFDGSVKLFKYYIKNVNKDSELQQNMKQIICYKSFAIYQNIQSNGCILSTNSKIISSSNNDLKEYLKSRGAEENECNLGLNQQSNSQLQIDLVQPISSSQLGKK